MTFKEGAYTRSLIKALLVLAVLWFFVPGFAEFCINVDCAAMGSSPLGKCGGR